MFLDCPVNLPHCVAGTALYVYNDAVFTVEDWNGIQEIARSRKREDPLKVGRFGIGFNSVYHVTGEDCLEMLNIISVIKCLLPALTSYGISLKTKNTMCKESSCKVLLYNSND